jgi:hypothetical protein
MVESYISAYNNFDVAGMVENLDTKIVFENYSNGNLTHCTNGLEEFKKLAMTGLEYFSSRSQSVISWEISKNNVLLNIKYKGIAKINFPTGIKAGEKIELVGRSEFTFHDNKIIRIIDKS